MATPAIRVEGLGKRYRLAHGQERARYRTLRESLTNLVKAPFQKRTTTEEFWALNDVSFEVQPGEVVGIIGRNGAGKSTLLKILSRITKPTTGRVELNGRVGSLLEVGTGFHPELTGRENIYLNGSILGMSRIEIAKKFDEIVAFAEVEKFLDTPVKRYSSGMYVRLAFAVAAHLEPEILIVDEVLAVGDAGFQKKCLGKMRDCATSGITVLLVSHQLNSVRDLCRQSIWLDCGAVRMAGATPRIIEQYFAATAARGTPGGWQNLDRVQRGGTGGARFSAIRYHGIGPNEYPIPDGPFRLSVRLRADAGLSSDLRVEFQILDRYQTKLVVANTLESGRPLQLAQGESTITFALEQLHLAPGEYMVNLLVGDSSELLDVVTEATRVEVVAKTGGGTFHWNDGSLVTRTVNWDILPTGECPVPERSIRL